MPEPKTLKGHCDCKARCPNINPGGLIPDNATDQDQDDARKENTRGFRYAAGLLAV